MAELPDLTEAERVMETKWGGKRMGFSKRFRPGKLAWNLKITQIEKENHVDS